ncbi:glycosyltransferase [Cohnella sp. GCM10012308]|uniref:glycosyltransferase n=1 Tax=Cohnella sp. GCM10012308 TaxID=3317329 RepID=UPI0036065D44
MIKVSHFLKQVELYHSENLIEAPKISVILPTYCRGDNGLLSRSIESVLNQTFREIELIIVDDGSVDRTRQVVMEYIENDPRVVYIRNNVNSGLPALRVNQGIIQARGAYIAYQFDDDQWYDDALELLYGVIVKENKPTLVYGKCRFKDLLNKAEIIFGDTFDYNLLKATNTIANNTVLHSKDIPYLYGGYDCHVTMKRLCDWDLWCRWSEHINIVHVNAIVSLVEGNQEDSLGRTVVLDQSIFKYIQNINEERNTLLRLDAIHEYVVDRLDFINKSEIQQLIYDEHLLHWYAHQRKNGLEEYVAFPKQALNIAVIMSDYNATTEITLENFAKKLKGEYNFMYITLNHLDHRIIEYADIVVLQRIVYKIPEIDYLIANRPMVYLLDDNLLKLHLLNRNEYAAYRPNSEAYKTIQNYISFADMVYSTTNGISRDTAALNKSVYQLSTNIPLGELKAQRSAWSGVWNIAWIGSDSRTEEFKYFYEEIRNLASNYETTVAVYFIGMEPFEQSQNNIHFVPRVQRYGSYLSMLRELNVHLILSPLEEVEFKNDKSNIKMLESGAAGAIGIFSNKVVSALIKDGHNGFMIDYHKGALYNKIRHIISMDQESLDQIYQNALTTIEESYSTESQVDQFKLMLKWASLNHIANKINKNFVFICTKHYWEEIKETMTRLKQYNYHVMVSIDEHIPSIIDWCRQADIEIIEEINEAWIRDSEVGLVHDLTSNTLIQWYCHRHKIAYVLGEMFRTYHYIQNKTSTNSSEADLLDVYIRTLSHFYNANHLQARSYKQERGVESRHIFTEIYPGSNNKDKKYIALREKYRFPLYGLLPNLIGLRLYLKSKIATTTSLTIGIQSNNRKDLELFSKKYTITIKPDEAYYDFYLISPLTHTKQANLMVSICLENTDARILIAVRGKQPIGESIYHYVLEGEQG